MYRMLSIKSSTLQNVRLIVGQCAPKFDLIAAQRTLQPNFLPISSDNTILQPSDKLRVSLQPVGDRHQSTHSSASTQTSEVKKKRKGKPKFTKYVEFLEVTNSVPKERKAKLKRLKAEKLQDFIFKTQQKILEKRAKSEKSSSSSKKSINSAGSSAAAFSTSSSSIPTKGSKIQQPLEYQKFDLEVLNNSINEPGVFDEKPLIFLGKHAKKDPEDIKNITTSFNNFREIVEAMNSERHEEMMAYNFHDEKLEEAIPDIVDIAEPIEPYVNPQLESRSTKKKVLDSKAKQSRYKSKYHINEDQERIAREQALIINLNSYLKACVSSGMVNRGLTTILSYRQRAKKRKQAPFFTIDLYNILLHGYAEKGSFERFKEIFAVLEEDGVVFNEQTFAAIFECLGRTESSEQNIHLIRKYIKKAEEMGMSLDFVMDKSKFEFDQKDIALDAIRRIHPDFVPQYKPPNYDYNNVLLNELNNHDVEESKNTATRSLIMQSKEGFTKEQLQQMARDQLKIELDGSITIKSIENTKEFANADFCREKMEELYTIWKTQINTAVNRDLNTLRAQIRYNSQGNMTYYTYLKILDSSQYVDILLKEIRMLAEGSETYSPTVGQLYKNLGMKVQQRYQIEQKKRNGILEKVGEIYGTYCDKWEEGTTNDNPRQIWQRLVHEKRPSGPSMDIIEAQWPKNVLAGVGRFLYNILMRDIKIDSYILRAKNKNKQSNLMPAFYTLFRNQGRLMKEEVKPHPVLARLLRASRQQTLTFDSNLVPMLCPPQPWSTPYNGGYLLNKSELIRLPHQAVQQWQRIKDANPRDLYPALDSLNQLASIPWRVNTDILDVIIEVFQNGGNNKLDVPQPPNSLPSLPKVPDRDSGISNVERAKLFKEKMLHRRKQSEMYSLWCDTLYRLSLANHYRDKVFWLPHNMDFRGRVYPLPPHLNHLGSDLARSMLIFDQAQPMGEDGFSWLKLHCINLTGMKKRDSVRERLLFAEEVMDDILDSADNPLTGRMWWAKSDEPWQTLSCCQEIAKVYRCPDPAKYMSRFPIHQDGSCNGLQHYAALGRDEAGAISVNLAPSPIPQDVYSAIATLVEKMRKTDSDNGLHVAQVLDGFVRRKVIKQTVMTTVYGVTRYGARLQIARQLKDIDNFPKEWVWPASTYLTTKTFESLREMFTSTKEIQDWFTECSRLISGVCNQNVEWVTPLGLPVVQHYNRIDHKNVPKSNKVSSNMSMDMYEKPNIMKQKNAFPPNFIHSLDSSHMMLTSLHCERKGLTFISVHDCFWTHACTVPDMNKICREQFVALHSQPILEDLSKLLLEKFSFSEKEISNNGSSEDMAKLNLNRVLKQLPAKGDFDLSNVLKSVYFFS
ncbi:DNA-directed RNA polymerase, mitochondrial [Episyrphus balteatus]|uniref:DNA-directed RNA polymerase, mitochondrial n=1 Tax=Episyrphus balteatus TaxID=286459 RepID=UPI00248560E0|nr:DNA-directed RNA polymerase, mitochondrial [Episyrphus balteatus]